MKNITEEARNRILARSYKKEKAWDDYYRQSCDDWYDNSNEEEKSAFDRSFDLKNKYVRRQWLLNIIFALICNIAYFSIYLSFTFQDGSLNIKLFLLNVIFQTPMISIFFRCIYIILIDYIKIK